jgi:hypothetical protein
VWVDGGVWGADGAGGPMFSRPNRRRGVSGGWGVTAKAVPSDANQVKEA